MCKVAVIVPAYNEEKTVGNVVEAFHHELPAARIVVVDNDSTDATEAMALAALRRLGSFGELITELRRGKGNAVRRAFLEVDADVYVLVDADMTYSATQVRELLRPVQDGEVDMVVGDRLTREQYRSSTKRPLHCFGNRLVRRLVNLFFRANLVDVMSGYRAMSRSFVKTYPLLAEGFQIETEMTLHCLDKRFRVKEVPVDYFARPPDSKSKLSTVCDGARVIFTIFRGLRQYRPLVFFGAVSAFVESLSFLLAAPVLRHWFKYRQLFDLPSALLAGSLGSIALCSLVVGLILDWMAYQQKQNFERELLQTRTTHTDHRTAAQQPDTRPSRPYARAV